MNDAQGHMHCQLDQAIDTIDQYGERWYFY